MRDRAFRFSSDFFRTMTRFPVRWVQVRFQVSLDPLDAPPGRLATRPDALVRRRTGDSGPGGRRSRMARGADVGESWARQDGAFPPRSSPSSWLAWGLGGAPGRHAQPAVMRPQEQDEDFASAAGAIDGVCQSRRLRRVPALTWNRASTGRRTVSGREGQPERETSTRPARKEEARRLAQAASSCAKRS